MTFLKSLPRFLSVDARMLTLTIYPICWPAKIYSTQRKQVFNFITSSNVILGRQGLATPDPAMPIAGTSWMIDQALELDTSFAMDHSANITRSAGWPVADVTEVLRISFHADL